MSMKKSSDTIGNRTRELPVCSAVPQPLRHRVPPYTLVTMYKHNGMENVSVKILACQAYTIRHYKSLKPKRRILCCFA
jgi:hypothetical protein